MNKLKTEKPVNTKSKLMYRYIVFFIGITLNSIGIALMTKSNLGTSQISSIPYIVSLYFDKISFGMATFLLNFIFFIIQIFILKKNFKAKRFLQLPFIFIFGMLIDLDMKILDLFDFSNIFIKIVALLIGCVILAFGISVEIAPDVVKIPGESLVYTIADVKNIRFGTVKFIFDAVLVAVAVAFSIWAFGGIDFNTIGIGTILSVLTVGKLVNLFEHKVSKIYSKFYN
ncbi:MAG: DUF6198 family protein [Peptoniphilus sp.]|uniref:YczE/YyaS/YitT family protein n=1 Tax=Peptoniphilus sp. TaxID=1971214 RepID=UPI002A74FC0F|nr:DUF6198 family protein [Peptoniphilus sp.]MDY2987465.1 DUF6198 family protein [Peptoniphilus sp.]